MEEVDINKIIVDLVKEFTFPVLEGVKRNAKDSMDVFKANFDLILKSYLNRSYAKYSKTKTLLYREVPVKLKDFYVRTDLVLGASDYIKESNFIEEIVKNRRIIISGSAGTGKSTFCKSILVDLIENPKGILPIFIELRHLNGENNKKIIDYIVKSLSEVDPSFTIKQLETSLRLGKVLLIMDGFDEINYEDRDALERDIIKLSNSYHNVMIMVSSRPDHRFDSWEEFYHYRVLPLDKDKALNLINKLEYDEQVKESFLKALNEKLFDNHESFARNPLLLTMMLLTYEQIAEIPNKIHLFYEQAFLTLFNKHDSLKSLYKRKSFSGLPLDLFKKVLSAFCILSYVDRVYFFKEEQIIGYIKKAIEMCGVDSSSHEYLNDLLDSVCIIQRDGLGYTFTHRSFQEYFTALYLANMAVKNKFKVFDKIAFVNDRDDVVSMIYDINPDLLEQEWIISKLENLVNSFSTIPYTNDGKMIILSKLSGTLILHSSVEEIDGNEVETQRVSPMNRRKNNNNSFFIRVLRDIYSDEFHDYFKSRYVRTESSKKAMAELIRIDFKDNNIMAISKPGALKRSTKSRIVKAGCCEFSVISLDFAKEKLVFLKEKYKAKEEDINTLLLGI